VTDYLDRLRTGLADRYQIEREIGRGGMARVFLAEERHPRRQVAIKVLDPAIASALGSDRFLREVDLASKLAHPNILPVFAAGEVDGILYYAMPFVEGESLRQRLAREKQLPVNDALQITREVADALEYAHGRGVIHRDIKPENLLLQSGHAVVADFGIARAVSVAGGNRITQTGFAVGTPAYMSPEQAAGEDDVDGRSDIYSLGCVLYEMMVGEPPFTGPTAASVVRQHLSLEPRELTVLRPAVSASTGRAVARALAKMPADRFATAAEFARSISADGLASEPPTKRGAGRKELWLALGAAAMLLSAAAVWMLRPRAGPPLDANAVAVFPFRVSGAGSGFDYLREGMVDLLAAKLTGEGGPRSVDPRTVIAAWRRAGGAESADLPEKALLAAATGIGAGHALLGSAVATPNRLALHASLVSVLGAGPTITAEVGGSPDSLHVLVDQLAGQLLARQAGAGERLAARTSGSLPALRAYLDGQAAYRRGRYGQAEEHFVRALELDTTFALAGLGLISARYWTTGTFDETGMAAAWAHRNRLSVRDSALLVGITGPDYPGPILAIRSQIDRLEGAVQLGPDRPEAWYWLGEALYHTGAAAGIVDPNPRSAEAFSRATTLDPEFVAPVEHLLEFAAAASDTAAVRRHADRYLALEPAGDLSDFTRWRAALSLGDSVGLQTLRGRFDQVSTLTLRSLLGSAVLDGVGLDGAERAIAVLRARAEARESRTTSLLRVYETLLNLGRPAEALAVTGMIGTLDDGSKGHLALRILGALFGGGDTTAAAAAARELESTVGAAGRSPAAEFHEVPVCAVMLWRLAQGRTAGVRPVVDRMATLARRPTRDAVAATQNARICEVTLGALLAARERAPGAELALASLDSISRNGLEGSQELLNVMNLTAARLFEERGDLARARAALRRFFHYRGTYLSTRLAMEGRLADQMGDRDTAIRAYRHYLVLRRDSEPAVASEVEGIKAALVRLSGERPS